MVLVICLLVKCRSSLPPVKHVFFCNYFSEFTSNMYIVYFSILRDIYGTLLSGSVYSGVDFCKRLCGVSVIRRYFLLLS